MTSSSHYLFESPIGTLDIIVMDCVIHEIKWAPLSVRYEGVLTRSPPEMFKPIVRQLHDYFDLAHSTWHGELFNRGTVFQKKVWQYLQCIPLGETRTYSDVADALNSSPRAIANACRANPFVITVPCHRVVSKTGLGGYNGQTTGENMKIKQWLLAHEQQG